VKADIEQHGVDARLVATIDFDGLVAEPRSRRYCLGRGRPPCLPSDGRIGQPHGVAPTMSLPDLVYRFKTLTTNRYIHGVRKSGWTPFSGRLWQRNYYEHIIRDQAEFNRIRDYVANNPLQWKNYRENPSRSMSEGADIKSVREKEPWKA
jgi:hypothetical protein